MAKAAFTTLRVRIVVIVALISSLPIRLAEARIGESRDEIDARYGRPVERGGNFAVYGRNNETRTYYFNGFTIDVLFDEHRRSVIEVFFKFKDRVRSAGNQQNFSENEIYAIRSAYRSSGVKWEERSTVRGFRHWESADGRLSVTYGAAMLEIDDREFVGRMSAAQSEKERERLKGF